MVLVQVEVGGVVWSLEVAIAGVAAVLSFRLCGLLLEVGDQVVPVLALLETTERHLRAGDVLLWVLEVFKLCRLLAYCPDAILKCAEVPPYQCALVPCNALLLVCV